MPKAPLRILIVAALCALGLIGLVVRESMARDAGTEVLLAMEAVDPRSLLSGHYVIVGLRERLADGEPCPEQAPEPTWLALAADGERYGLAGSAPTREEAEQIASIVVRGQFSCNPPTPPEGEFAGAPGFVMLDLGVSRFHIKQADAERIDRILRAQTPGEATRAFAIVSIGRDGRARLKGLMVDGERLELSWL